MTCRYKISIFSLKHDNTRFAGNSETFLNSQLLILTILTRGRGRGRGNNTTCSMHPLTFSNSFFFSSSSLCLFGSSGFICGKNSTSYKNGRTHVLISHDMHTHTHARVPKPSANKSMCSYNINILYFPKFLIRT